MVPLDVVVFSTGYGFLVAALVDFVAHREWRPAALAGLVPIGMASSRLGLADVVQRLTPLTYDGTLLALDATLRIPFSRLAGNLFTAVPLVRALSLIAYAALPGAIAGGLAYEEYAQRRGLSRGVGVNLLLAYMVSGTIAALLYVLCPATGPAHAFAGMFPRSLPAANTVPLYLAPFASDSPRNAMPSLHVAWAVLLARSLAGARPSVRIAAWIFAGLTMLATLGSGEHYLFDLVAVAPFLAALEAATAHRSVSWRRRAPALLSGAALYGLLMIVIADGSAWVPRLDAAPPVAWALVAIALLIPATFALRPVPSAPGAQLLDRRSPVAFQPDS
ncbi:MAG: phosphatase PAP2 family protein, partial [Gemmatimonas sp.]